MSVVGSIHLCVDSVIQYRPWEDKEQAKLTRINYYSDLRYQEYHDWSDHTFIEQKIDQLCIEVDVLVPEHFHRNNRRQNVRY